MVKNIQLLYIFIIFLLIPTFTYGQTGSPSVYTIFGVGTINNTGLVKNQGMGGTGLALKSDNFINPLNPASLTGIDSLNMLIDLGLRIGYTHYDTNEDDGNATSGGLKNVSLAFRSTPNIYTSFGISQFSYVGYNVSSETTIGGTSTSVDKDYEGSGGINEVYLSNAIRPFKNLALGLKISYLFGSIDKTETYTSTTIGGYLVVEYTDYMKQFRLEPGFQYDFKIKDNLFTLGTTFTPALEFATSRVISAYSSSGAAIEEDDDDDDNSEYELPVNIAGGIAWVNNKGLKVAFDYRFQQWSDTEYSNIGLELQDSHRFSGGAEFRNINTRKASPFLWQMGGYYEDTYIRVEGNSIIDAGINAGVGIPMRNSRSYFNLNVNYGRRGTRGGDLITENYLGLNLSLSMVEFWFRKRQIE